MSDATHPRTPEQSPERVNSTAYNAVRAAVIERLESIGENPEVYDLDWIALQFQSPAAVRDLDMTEWFRLVLGAAVEDETSVPCPPWCRYPQQHRFESEDNNGRQLRYHSRDFPAPRGVDISITQEESREKADDHTVRRGPIRIWLTAENDGLDAGGSRRIAASLRQAADELDEIAGSEQRTEDRP